MLRPSDCESTEVLYAGSGSHHERCRGRLPCLPVEVKDVFVRESMLTCPHHHHVSIRPLSSAAPRRIQLGVERSHWQKACRDTFSNARVGL